MTCQTRNLVGIFFCMSTWLMGVSQAENGRWLLPNKDLMNEDDIQKEVDKALQLVNKETFQGWPLEQIKQAVPRLHIGLIEIWLQFQKLPKEQSEMWRKLRRMTRETTASCQEVKAEMSDLGGNLTSRLEALEKQLAAAQRRAKVKEEGCRRQCANASLNPLDANQTHARPQSGQGTESQAKGRKNETPGTNRSRETNVDKLAQKVASLTDLLHGHNELLVELYQRVTALEATQKPQRVLPGVQNEGESQTTEAIYD